ncbi:SDR family NAD(P)-dependent oxidoreductase [Rhodoferax sp.]|uniref:SDR family NAD(P)-dependent oxidoreductase n=1 Tax=Rhodoferax sp. TaxID=50421 RepID=UPI00374D8FEA
MAGRLAGKTALISGGATGAGGAASKLFAAEGAKVAVIDINVAAGEAVVAEILAAGGEAAFFAADVSQRTQIEQAVAAATARFGTISVLFNHAGTIIVKPFLDTSDEDYDRLMDINVKSMFMMTRAVLPQMLAAGKGSIVCTASISSVAATPLEVLYCMTKGACAMLARAVAVEYRDRGIRCNAVCPGFIDTPHGQREIKALAEHGFEGTVEALSVQQGRLCQPEEVAKAALFLASDDASFVNGAHLYVDNCFTAA